MVNLVRRRLLVPVALIGLLIACGQPLNLPADVRLDAITPTTGTAGTHVELAGLFTAATRVEVCGVPLEGLALGKLDRVVIAPGIAGDGSASRTASGVVPAIPAATTCDVTLLVEGVAVAGTNVTFTSPGTTGPGEPEEPGDPEEPSEPVVEGIVVSPSIENLIVGSFTQFRAISVADDSDVTGLVMWSSSDEAVATVSNDPGTSGLVTALGAGVTTIKAESALGSGTGVITVLAGMPTVNGVVVSDMADASIGWSNTSRNIAVGRDLSVHVAWVDNASDVRYSRSRTSGADFEASVLIGSATSTEVSVATSGSDHVYIAYTSALGLGLAQSHDGGDTWSTTDLFTGMLEPQLGLAVHQANVYVMVGSWEGFVLLRSEDYGASFTQVALPFGSLAFFDVLVDPRNGDVYAIGDDPTIYYSISHDAGATFSAAQTVDPTYGVFYSDYSISQLGEIVIAGGIMEAQASLWNIDTDEWSSVPNPGTVIPQGASAAIDGANTIHIINLSEMTPGTIQLATSFDRGLTYDLITVATGTQADIAPSTFVVGSPIIYNDAGVIKYSFIPNAD